MIQAVAVAASIASLSWLAAGAVPEVSLSEQSCPTLPHEDVVRLVALELDARVVDPATASPQATRIAMVCSGSAIHLAVSDPMTGKQLIREIGITTDDPKVSARGVALAASELVLTSWMELTLSKKAMAVTDATPSVELRRAAEERVRRFAPDAPGGSSILALGQAIGPFQGAGRALGAGLRVGYAWTPLRDLETMETTRRFRPAVDLDLVAARSFIERPLGQVRAALWSGTLRGGWRCWFARSWLEAGIGARVGLARLEGTPSAASIDGRGRTLEATWGGASLYAGGGFAWRSIRVAAGLEVGRVLRSVVGLVDDAAPVAIAGNWAAATVGLGWGQ